MYDLTLTMGKIDSVQYSAALAVPGAWRRTPCEKIHAELGWESLSSRRWSRRMILFYKSMNNSTPLYTKKPKPPPQHVHYFLQTQDVIGGLGEELKKFSLAFIPTAYLNETSLILKLGLYYPLVCSKLILYQ